MKYCLLIHISRNFISFSYNKEGDKGFIPYGEEPIKPLAVYCQGNEISIGKFALSEAQKGNKYAHANLFDAMSSTELIEYKGQKHDINKLLFFAMEKYVAEFFDKILMRSEGSLEDNRAHFPVVVFFNPDLRFHERDYVFKSLKDGGYGNLWKINASEIFEKVACSKMDTGIIPVFVGGDGYNLYCESEKAKLPEIVTMEKVAMDPRIDRAMRIMWADILHQGYDEFRSDKDNDVKVLRKYTCDFLKSSKREQMSSVVLSDGLPYDLFLKRSDFGMSSGSISEEAMVAFSKLKDFLKASGTQASQCYIVLTDREVVTEYVENLFRHYFPHVFGINDEQRYSALQVLAEMVASMGYKFPTSSQDTSKADMAFMAGKFKEARDLYKSTNSAAAGGKIDDCTSCIKDERRIREFLSLPVEAQMREKDDILDIFCKWAKMGVNDDYINSQREKLEASTGREADRAFKDGRFEEARELYKSMNSAVAEVQIANCNSCIKDERRIREFLSLPVEAQMREKDDILDIFCKWAKLGVCDDYINLHREKLGKRAVQEPPKTDTKPEQPDSPNERPPESPVQPLDVKKVRRECREVMAQAKRLIREGKTAEAKKELMAFVVKYKDKDVDIHEAEQLLSGIGGYESSEGDRLMKELKFKEARAWFADNGFASKAADCSKLIKAVRSLKAYKAEISSIKNNHNIQLAKSHLGDMEGWLNIYKKYGLDTKDIDEIINIYRSIK